ncbi:Hypothetical protein ORPV_755 [Orpheovirus IHUMI-LCC2]|uniref:F-box domain-containing protein n=1 Tax=Orpheovirus IHUMI-LCC2 TaxID=2023057 RepID=A0A2I2L5C5_9VIRU|nr:Hypothetical protein ORPV_755 [Orpheovirus IHUMI-LCC2]SNW62659.1 Hypothetical protein ORPV_755 [Orpheovirus IHUMI-LCC2]
MSILDLPDDIILHHLLHEDLDVYISLYRLCKRMNLLANKLGKDHYVYEQNIEGSDFRRIYTNNKKTNEICKIISILKYESYLEDGLLGTICNFFNCEDDHIHHYRHDYITITKNIETWCKKSFKLKYDYMTYYNTERDIRREIRMKNTYIKIGRHIQYDKVGNIVEEINYNNNGKLHGRTILPRTKWNDVSKTMIKVRIEADYINGILNGTYKIYNYENDILIEEGSDDAELFVVV